VQNRQLRATILGTDEAALRRIMLDSPSFQDLADEGRCRMLLLALFYGMRGYRPPTSNREASDGRADVLIEPEPESALGLPAIVVEVRRPRDGKGADLGAAALKADARDNALGQALANGYAHGLRGSGRIWWGVSFAGRRLSCACEVEED
jgi:hypothetical protein